MNWVLALILIQSMIQVIHQQSNSQHYSAGLIFMLLWLLLRHKIPEVILFLRLAVY